MFLNCCGCCDGPTAIVIYNSNAIADHDFDVTLNGTLIGNRAGATVPLCKATIWRPDNDPVIDTWTGLASGCSPIYEYFELDPELWIDGNNTLVLETTATNSIDNFGIIRVDRLRRNSDDSGWESCKTFLSSTYTSGFDPVTLTYNFTWTP